MACSLLFCCSVPHETARFSPGRLSLVACEDPCSVPLWETSFCSRARCHHVAAFRKRGSPLLEQAALLLCLDGWRNTQQEPENDDVADQQERHIEGQKEPGHAKVKERQASHRSLVHSEQQVSDAHQIEQPDQRERPSWPEP